MMGGKHILCPPVSLAVLLLSLVSPLTQVLGGSGPTVGPKTPIIATKYGQLRGFYRALPAHGVRVATYLGVPYATPPVGANRFSPTRTLSQWVGVHEATAFGPACPQRLPDLSNETLALQSMSRSKYEAFKRYMPTLRSQSEDCLYLNLYVPEKESGSAPRDAYPVVVFVHGESWEWGSASLYDGSVLAALGRVIVVTINYRLGILGFFNPNVDPVGRATVANYGLMDQVAALHWVQENIVRFGGDPGHVTVMGHATGSACLNFLIMSPTTTGAGLFKRAILMSGSAMSPWATVQEPVYYAVKAATQLGCSVPDDLYNQQEAIQHCLRDKTIDQILKVSVESPQFLSWVGPSVDGVTIKQDWRHQMLKMGERGRTPVDILLGISSNNIYDVFTQEQIQHGFKQDHRDRIFRTFVNNNYRYHLQEIVLAIMAEYTDWARPLQQPLDIRDLTAHALHDASLVTPVTLTANHFSTNFRSEYLYVLHPNQENSSINWEMQEDPRFSLNELVYVFGGPLGATGPFNPVVNYSKADVELSEEIITLWTNFIKTGNPNRNGVHEELVGPHRERTRYHVDNWPIYRPEEARYIELGSRSLVRDHYRASRVALWSWLVPGLELVGSRHGPDSPFHRLPDHHRPETFSGPTRPTNLSSNYLPPPTTAPPTTPRPITTLPPRSRPQPTVVLVGNSSSVAELMEDLGQQARHPQAAHFPYTTALSLTVAIGCSLLILNLLVFAAVYYRRDASRMVVAKPLSHGGSGDGLGSDGGGSDVQLRVTGDTCKPTSPSHCGTLRSSATLRSTLATSCDSDAQHEWPPDYSSTCCQAGTLGRHQGPGHLRQQQPQPQNGTATLRPVHRPPRSSSFPSQAEAAQPLLSPPVYPPNNQMAPDVRV